MSALIHQLADLLRLIGLRDRLRCPECKAVGTWKPHGGWLDVKDKRKVRRWMCKWCGLYRGPEDCHKVVPSPREGCWVLLDAEPSGQTPLAILHLATNGGVWPWRG